MAERFNFKLLNNMNKRVCLKKVRLVNNLHQPFQTVFNPVRFDLDISIFDMRDLRQVIYREYCVLACTESSPS